MESLNHILDSITQGCFMAVLDLTDAYLTVPIGEDYIRFLKFIFQGQVYCYICLPFGISSAPRKFTKLLKPIAAFLRSRGIVVVFYIDDVWLTALTYHSCLQSVLLTAQTFSRLGFLLNRKKSKPRPSTKVTVLGFDLDSVAMLILLPQTKKDDVILHCTNLLSQDTHTIRYLARVLGKIISCFPALPLARAHYRYLEKDKNRALTLNGFNFEATTSISMETESDLHWLIAHLPTASAPIRTPPINLELFTDASFYGWGAVLLDDPARGLFSEAELVHSINTKESLAILYAVLSFLDQLRHKHVLIRTDNTTALAVMSQMGTMKHAVHDLVSRFLWFIAEENNITFSFAHIPGILNTQADFESRTFNPFTEWTLPSDVFTDICSFLGYPCLDLFATRLNNKLDRYISWYPDPFCEHVDAFTLKWTEFAYAFPPFVLLSRVLTKISCDAARVLLIFPLWPNQPWFPRLLHMIVSPLVILKNRTKLFLPWNPQFLHPLHESMLLCSTILSGNVVESQEFRLTLQNTSPSDSESTLNLNMRKIFKTGTTMPFQGRLIPLIRL